MRTMMMLGLAAHALMSADVEAQVAQASIPEEYASMTLTIDHLAAEDHQGHTVLKTVWSTESAVESLLAQLSYFGLNDELKQPGVIDLISAGNKSASIYVVSAVDLVGRPITNVIVDASLWTSLVGGDGDMAQMNPDGTVLGAHAALISLAHDLKQTAAKQAPDQKVLAFISHDD